MICDKLTKPNNCNTVPHTFSKYFCATSASTLIIDNKYQSSISGSVLPRSISLEMSTVLLDLLCQERNIEKAQRCDLYFDKQYIGVWRHVHVEACNHSVGHVIWSRLICFTVSDQLPDRIVTCSDHNCSSITSSHAVGYFFAKLWDKYGISDCTHKFSPIKDNKINKFCSPTCMTICHSLYVILTNQFCSLYRHPMKN